MPEAAVPARSRRHRARAIVTTTAVVLASVGLAACGGDRPTIEAKTPVTSTTSASSSSSTSTTISLVDQAPSFANLLGYIAQPAGKPQVFTDPDTASAPTEDARQ